MRFARGGRVLGTCCVALLLLSVPLFAQNQQNSSTQIFNQAGLLPGAGLHLTALPAAAPAPKPQGTSHSSDGREGSKWEVEFHVGGTFNTDLSGTATAFPAATTLTPDALGGTQTFYPTYFFGPGAANLNTVWAFNGEPTIAPFDTVLQSNILQRDGSAAFGVRLSRDIHPRFTLEGSVDYNFGELKMNGLATGQTATTAASWGAAMQGFIDTAFPGAGTATATGTFRNSGTAQLSYTGALLFNLKTEGHFIPYISVGGGGLSNFGSKPAIDLTGNLNITALQPVTELDHVKVRFDIPALQGVFLFGAGFKYYFTDHWGVRVDVRDHMIFGNHKTLVSANPGVTDTACGVAYFNSDGTNDVFFSCDQAFVQSNLNTTPFNKITTFTTDGVQHQIKVDFGVLLRF